MSQLIALIIAIALGAIVTAIGYVFLGDAFTSNSERGVALQMVNQASQVEMAMTAYRAENAASAWSGDGTNSFTDYSSTEAELVNENFLKDSVVSPVQNPTVPTDGGYQMFNDNGNTFIVVQADVSSLSNNVCSEIEQLAGRDGSAVTLDPFTLTQALTVVDTRYHCFTNTGATQNYFIYEVE